MQPRFIYLESYGCSANQNNAEIIRGMTRRVGLDIVENPEIADILILNTCVVKGPTLNRMMGRIQDLSKLNKPIIVAGCMPEVRKKELVGEGIFLLGISHVAEITKLIRRISESKYEPEEFLEKRKEIKLNCPKLNQNRKIGITQISEGCLGSCNFCLVKLVKGNLFSYPDDKILENMKKDLKAGCKEIWLTSQDNAAYGSDSGTNFASLLKKILAIDSSFRLRVGMMNQNNVLPILDELIECYKHEKTYQFLHLPLQSGSDKILRLMNRQYTTNEFLNIIKKFKAEIPDITISTDVILAYPSESEKDYQETLKIIREIKPDIMNITRYWPMRGTKAAILKQIPVKIAKKRAAEIQKLHLKIALENNKKLEEKEFRVLVNEQSGTNCLARNDDYKLIVIKSNKNLLGKFVNVKIKEAFPHYLLAELVEK